MKAFALKNRSGQDARKDAYDIYYCLSHHPGSLADRAMRFRSLLVHPLALEGLNCLADLFASVDHVGPRLIADRADTEDERAFIRRDAYERVNTLIEYIHFL